MIFSERFIRKPIMTTLIVVAVLIFGVAAYNRLPISDLPSVDYPVITITVYYPGASPSMMASTVASPLETQCMQIPGLQTVISQNTMGQSTITLTFELGRSVDLAAPDVEAAISRAAGDLPNDLPEPPSYTKTNPSDTPVLYLMLTSDTMTPGQLYDYGHRVVGQRINILSGVSQIQVWGAKSAVRVQVNPYKLASYGIGIDEVAQALRKGTVTIPGGSLDGPFRAFSIEPQGQLLKAEDYKKLIIAYRDNAPVYLGDIATCIDSLQNDVVNVMYGRADGKMRSGSVVIPVYRQSGANTVALSKRVRDTMEQLRQEIPASVQLDIFYDKAVQIIASVRDVKNTIIIALILVVMVIFLFLGRLSDTVIPGTVLPVSIISTFIIMLAAGFSLDNLSLMGLTLCVGFLVDDAIVVLENTVRHIEKGEKPLPAAIKSMGEITGAVISTSVALIAVFIPLVFMGGVIGRNFSEFALTVVFAIICSTIAALTLTPMMCARMLSAGKKIKTKTEMFTERFVGRMVEKYKGMLIWTLKHKMIAVIVWALCISGSLMFFIILPKDFMPVGDSGAITGQMLAKLGTSTEQIQKFQDYVNNILQGDPAVEKVISATGLQPGADQTTGPFFVVLKPSDKRPDIQVVAQRIREKMAVLPFGFSFLRPLPSLQLSTGGESTAAGSQYSYVLSGEEKDAVYQAALEIERRMKAMPYFTDVQNSVKLEMPQLDMEILRDRASTFGITAGQIEEALALAYAQGKITTYKTDVDQYYVITEVEKKYSRNPDDLARIYLRSPLTGDLVPLGSVAKWKDDVGPQNVPHYDQRNSATISFNVRAGVPLGTATTALVNMAEEVTPPAVNGLFQGEAQEFEEAVAGLTVLLFVSIFVMYVILGVLYESYIHPFTVLTTLPVAAFGGLLTLFVFGSQLSIYAYIGMFMLLGIVSKNGILMVDFANQNLEEEGSTAFDAIFNACIIRFRPILMTGASTIMGAMPIALGFGADGASRRPLGLVIVGGLVFAQVITLFVTPGIFLYMQTFQERHLDRFELFRSVAERKRRGEF